ncbi:MAG TPA: IPT/TIG domain-containing protein [Bryobacteraceae bacterium]|nr:IPT/TIG domain-containing protein [Bryobacteraceae bacterium]
MPVSRLYRCLFPLSQRTSLRRVGNAELQSAVGLGVALLGCSILSAAGITLAPRYPQGVYVIVGPNEVKDVNLLAANPAISGLTVYVEWSTLNPNPPTISQLPAPLDCSNLPHHDASDPYDWSIPDAAFCAVASVSPPKTVQLVVRPGFDSPQWVLDQIDANSCSGQFVFLTQPYYVPASPVPALPPNPTPACHLAYFDFAEGISTPTINGAKQALYRPLPMPWDPTYKNAWQTFLIALSARYGQNPAFVAIAVAGPTAESAEILLPNTASEVKEWSTILQNQFSDSRYRNSDQAFIDEWQNAIDMFGRIFSDVTLVVVIAGGPPDFPVPYTLPVGASAYCAGSPTMNCGANYSILSYFIDPGNGGPNAKAVEMDGLHATPETWLGIPAVKLMTGSTALSTRILGGAEFAGGLPAPADALSSKQSYCPDATATNPDCSPQQAFYNTIAEFFDGTPAATVVPRLYGATVTSTFPTLAGGTKTGAAPLNYLQVYYGDITAASATAQVNTGESTSPSYSAQDLLSLAGQGLAKIAEQPAGVPGSNLSIAKTHTGNLFQGQSAAAYKLTVSNGGQGVATVGPVTVTETIPAGLALVSMSGAGWACSGKTCTRTDSLNPSSSYPAITVTVNVASNAPSQVVNQASVSGGGSAPLTATDPATVGPPHPAIVPGGIVPVSGSLPVIQPGEWVSIYGTNLATATANWAGNFPISLGGTSVTINGKAAYLSFVSPAQIDLQAPDDTAAGTVPVVVTTADGTVTATVTLAQFGPTFFLLDTQHVAGIILRSDNSGAFGGGSYDIIGPSGTALGYPTVAAKAGDTIELFGNGFGPTVPEVPAGQAFSGAARTTNPVTLRINNVSVTPAFAGLSGAGLYQINLTIPSGLGTGDVPIQAGVGGVETPAGVLISLR